MRLPKYIEENEQKTYREFGYYPKDLVRRSVQPIYSTCEDCDQQFITNIRSFHDSKWKGRKCKPCGRLAAARKRKEQAKRDNPRCRNTGCEKPAQYLNGFCKSCFTSSGRGVSFDVMMMPLPLVQKRVCRMPGCMTFIKIGMPDDHCPKCLQAMKDYQSRMAHVGMRG